MTVGGDGNFMFVPYGHIGACTNCESSMSVRCNAFFDGIATKHPSLELTCNDEGLIQIVARRR